MTDYGTSGRESLPRCQALCLSAMLLPWTGIEDELSGHQGAYQGGDFGKTWEMPKWGNSRVREPSFHKASQ